MTCLRVTSFNSVGRPISYSAHLPITLPPTLHHTITGASPLTKADLFRGVSRLVWVDQFMMQPPTVQIERPTNEPSPRPIKHTSTSNTLNNILWRELSLALARRALVLIDELVPIGSNYNSCAVNSYGATGGNTRLEIGVLHQPRLAILLHSHLLQLPQSTTLRIGNGLVEVLIGEANEPNVMVEIRY